MPHRFFSNKLTSLILTYGVIALSIFLTACSPGTRIAHKQPIQASIGVKDEAFAAAVSRTTHATWIEGNSITTLVNGKAFLSSMLKSIKSAEKSITFETYAFINGTAAYEFVDAFCERARQGVKVHLILDSAGSIDIGQENVERLRAAGVELTFYHPYSILNPLRYNTRDHRKIMVVDGKVGYTGGCGVADAWMGNAESPDQWRENHYKVTGPVVAQLQNAFMENWIRTGGVKFTGPDYFPPLSSTGQHRAQAFNSSPKDKIYTIPHLYRQVFASARESIVIENSYFIPDRSVMKELIAASKRGVNVEILVPGKHIDAWPVRSLARGYYSKLLRAGIQIYEYQPTMMHCKVLVVDGVFSSVGSANFDPRSLYINDESNLNVLDRGFASEQLRVIADDKKQSLRITKAPSRWNLLTLPKRVTAQILAPQL